MTATWNEPRERDELISSPRAGGRRARVCVVGPGRHFLSGITYYTHELGGALGTHFDVSALLMRRLLPRRLYPGRRHVGQPLSDVDFSPATPVFDGVDWFWLPSLFRAVRFLRREKPDVVIFQWWTVTVLHTYLVLALVARLSGARIIVEFHESQDVGEASHRGLALYARTAAPLLFRLTSEFIVHSEADRLAIADRYSLPVDRLLAVPHAAYRPIAATSVMREAPPDACNLLYFGVIREYKGVELLVEAFSALPADEVERYWLTVVGETWEGWDAPARLIADSPHRDRITVVDRYVTDAETAAIFAGADLVVLPYRRCSQSGPLQLAVGTGLPVVVTGVGGLTEAAAGYSGAVVVAPDNPAALMDGIRDAQRLVGRRFPVGHDWPATADAFQALIGRITRAQANDAA